MKVLIALAAAAVLGLGAVVLCHERPPTQRSTGVPASGAVDVATISTGERVDITHHVVAQGVTIVEFTADF